MWATAANRRIGQPVHAGGPISTYSGLTFYTGTLDHILLAFDIRAGDEPTEPAEFPIAFRNLN
jgi:hypothetical protein